MPQNSYWYCGTVVDLIWHCSADENMGHNKQVATKYPLKKNMQICTEERKKAYFTLVKAMLHLTFTPYNKKALSRVIRRSETAARHCFSAQCEAAGGCGRLCVIDTEDARERGGDCPLDGALGDC